jgi:hypothetical protein
MMLTGARIRDAIKIMGMHESRANAVQRFLRKDNNALAHDIRRSWSLQAQSINAHPAIIEMLLGHKASGFSEILKEEIELEKAEEKEE